MIKHKERQTGTDEGLSFSLRAIYRPVPVVIEEEVDPDMYLGVEPPVEIHVTQGEVDREDAMLIIPRPESLTISRSSLLC